MFPVSWIVQNSKIERKKVYLSSIEIRIRHHKQDGMLKNHHTLYFPLKVILDLEKASVSDWNDRLWLTENLYVHKTKSFCDSTEDLDVNLLLQ